jgi:signal peptidase I
MMAVLILLMVIAALVFLAPYFNWRVDVVYSGSMEPDLKVGGIAITQPVAMKDIKTGNVITFHSPIDNELISHRVIAVKGEATLYFQTKGDANATADPFIVTAENLVGRVCFRIPYFGYVARFIKTPLGLLLSLCLPGLAVIVLEILKIRRALAGYEI